MTPVLHFQSVRQVGARHDDWPNAADGVVQSMVTLGPDVLEAIVSQVRAALGRMIVRRRSANTEVEEHSK